MTRSTPRWLRWTVTGLGWAAFLAVVWLVWPTELGGDTSLLVVRGDSMEPAFHHGALLVTRRAHDYHVGDVVTFGVPNGPARGMRVVHRIIAIDTATGPSPHRATTASTADTFDIAVGDIDGRVRTHLPGPARCSSGPRAGGHWPCRPGRSPPC